MAVAITGKFVPCPCVLKEGGDGARKMIRRIKNKLLCAIGYHKYELMYSHLPKQVRYCMRCLKVFSTCYDMAYGNTYWVEGNLWMR